MASIQAPPGDVYGAIFWRAVMLSPTLETCRALLNGENVPVAKLDQAWVKRFSRR